MSADGGAPSIALAAVGLDRAGERRCDAAWVEGLLASRRTRFLALDSRGRILATDGTDAPIWLDATAWRTYLHQASVTLLGMAGESAYFMLRTEADQDYLLERIPNSRCVGLRELGPRLAPFDAGLCAYACGLAHWQAGMRFCPGCGSALAWFDAGHRAQCSSPTCARPQFPRSDPAIIVIVEHDGACLLGRQASWPEGRFSTLAGFVEPGETLEDAVRREVDEESGVRVVNCHYYASQPWPFPASLMLGFTATAGARELNLRDGELQEARWFTPEDIISGVHDGSLKLSAPLSVSWHLLDHWMQHRAGLGLADL